ncbi:MAG: 60S ribosomal export protein NMD3 [Candidatus Hodarchaeota archaeon]
MTLTAPCYECGEKADLEGLCAKCYRSAHPLVQVKTPQTLLICKRCGSVKVPGGWKAIVDDISDQEELLEREIQILLETEIKPIPKKIQLEFVEDKRLDRVLHVSIVASGTSHEYLPSHTERHPLEIRIRHATCDTCAMMSGGYHEAILQIRAVDRKVTPTEEEDIAGLVTDLTVAEYGKDVKAYVTEISKNKFGIDFKIGSEHLCRRIADELESRYLAERKENYKLVGQDRGGKRKYRITILIRLQKFSEGDFVKVGADICQVLSMGRSGLSCFNLDNADSFTINPKSVKWREIDYIAPEAERRTFMVVTRVHGQPVQLMESESFEMFEIDEANFHLDNQSGETIHGFLHEGRLYPLPARES